LLVFRLQVFLGRDEHCFALQPSSKEGEALPSTTSFFFFRSWLQGNLRSERREK